MTQEAKMRELVLVEQYVNPVEYQEVISVTPARPERRRKLEFSTPLAIDSTEDSNIQISPKAPEYVTPPKPVRKNRNVM